MKKLLILGAALLIAAAPEASFLSAEKKKPRILERYALTREMPVFLDSMQSALTYPLAWPNYQKAHSGKKGKSGEAGSKQTLKAMDSWRKAGRECIFDVMQILPPPAVNPTPRLIAEEKRDGYTARRYEVQLTDWYSVPFLMLVPDSEGPHPAVLLLHDHGGHYTIGKEKMIRPLSADSATMVEGIPVAKDLKAVMADADAWAEQCYGGRYIGDYLAKQGYVVAAADALMWGERGREEGQDGNMLGAICGNFGMLGANLNSYMTFDDMLMADVLASMPETDPERIGAMGFSMGAYRAWMLAAMSDTIKAFAAVCWLTTTKDQLSWEHGREKGGFTNQLPGLRRYMDYPHIASLAAPRAAYFINGQTDKLFNPAGVTDAFSQMREVWRDAGAESKLRTELWEQGHDCGLAVQDSIAAFFNQEL